jgi:hypothetical protein
MSPHGDLPSAMHPWSRRADSQSLTTADAERLLTRRGTHPEAPAIQHALAGLLDSATGPPSDQELAGEMAAVAAFVLVTSQRDVRGARRRIRFWSFARNGHAVAAAVGSAIALAFSGATSTLARRYRPQKELVPMAVPVGRNPAGDGSEA